MTYEYNAAGQITNQVFADGHSIQFTYDARGNLASTIENGVTNAYVANNLNQYTSVAGTNFQYDADGKRSFQLMLTHHPAQLRVFQRR